MANIVISASHSCVNGDGRIIVTVNTSLLSVRVHLYTLDDTLTRVVDRYYDIPGSGTVTFDSLDDDFYHVYAENTADVNDKTEEITVTINCDLPPSAITPCNIHIDSVAVAGDGITVTVSGNNGITEYSLDSFDTFQETNTFTGLAPGVYFVYARDKVNPACVDAYLFQIKKVYGPLYTHSFDSKYDGHITVNIYERNYTGEVIQLVKLGGEAVSISWNGADDDRFKGIKPSQCNITLMSDARFQYFRLFTTTDRQHKVEILSSTGGVLWQGFLLPNFYEEPYLSGPQPIKLTATDGLADLAQMDFKPKSAPLFPAFLSVMEALRFCLYHLDLDIPLFQGVNYYEAQMDTALDPFLQADFSNRFPVEGGKSINCFEAIERILQPFSARIFQMEGAWHVYEVDKLGKLFNRRKFNLDGGLLASDSYQSTSTILPPSEGTPRFINNSQYLTVLPPYKEQVIEFDYGNNLNLAKYGDWPKGSLDEFGKPKEWAVKALVEKDDQGKKLILSPVRLDSLPAEPYIESPPVLFTVNPAITVTHPVRVSLKFTSPLPSDVATPSPIGGYYQLWYSLRIGDYYATSGGGWVNTVQELLYGTSSAGTHEYTKNFRNPPSDGIMTIRVYVARANPDYPDSPSLVQYGVITYDYIRVEYGDLREGYADWNNEILTGTNSDDIMLRPDPIKLFLGDTRPGLFDNALYIAGDSTSTWTNEGVTESLQVFYLQNLLKYSDRPYLKLDCDLQGQVKFDAVVSDTVMPTKSFMPNSLTWDVVRGQYNCEYLEKEDVPVGSNLYVDADYVLDDYVL